MALPTLAHRIDGPAGSTAAPLLLLHDLAGDRRLWRPLRPLLSQQRRTISVDLRGHGESPVPPLGDGYDVATHAADLLRLLDALDVDRAVLVGSDLGGAIALEIACNAPERVEALVKAHHGASSEETIQETARLFGYKSTSRRLFSIISGQIDELLETGRMQERNGKLYSSVSR